MRILILSSVLPPDGDGGFDMNMFKLANQFIGRGHDVQVVTGKFRSSFKGDRSGLPWVHRLLVHALIRDYNGIVGKERSGERSTISALRSKFDGAVIRVGSVVNALAVYRVANLNQAILAEYLTANSFDVAYIGLLDKVGLSCLYALQQKGIPYVFHYGDEWLMAHRKPVRLRVLVLKMLSPVQHRKEMSVRTDWVVLVSKWLRDRYVERGFDPNHTFHIYRGIEFPLSTDVERQRLKPPVFQMACRLAIYKGVQVAIEAAHLLHQRNPERAWSLRIAGEAESPAVEAQLKQLVLDRGLSSRVKFTGPLSRNQVHEATREATAFISASIHGEPFANTIIESMGLGTPLIGSISGSIQEVVTHDVNGLLYEKEDPEALSRHMERLLDEPETCLRLAKAGVERIREKFTIEKILDETEAFFQKVIEAEKAERGSTV